MEPTDIVDDQDQGALLDQLKNSNPQAWARLADQVRDRVQDVQEDYGLGGPQIDRLIRDSIGRLRVILTIENPERLNATVALERMVRNGARLAVAYREFGAQTADLIRVESPHGLLRSPYSETTLLTALAEFLRSKEHGG